MTGLALFLPIAVSLSGANDVALSFGGDNTTALTVKTNAIPWAATIMNIEGEASLTDHISVTLPVMWCPWYISKSYAFRLLALQPEGRWWFRTPGKGHFAGVHLSLAWYNIKFGDFRYQDRDRPALGGGITYGYALPLNHSWGIEFSIGAGYISARYDRFYNTFNGSLVDSRQTSYFGIDHAAVSFCYTFNL